MKLILDSETLSINCKMTDVQEVFSDQALSNGLAEDIKNGEIFNGNSKVSEETNGITENGNCGTGETVDEKIKNNVELQIKDSKLDEDSEKISEESNDVLKKIEPEEDSSISSSANGAEDTNTEELPCITKEVELVKSPASQEDTSELQENASGVLGESTEIKEISPKEVDFTSQVDKCDSEISEEQIKKQDEVNTVEEVQAVELNTIGESESVEITSDTKNNSETVEKESEPMEVDEAIENGTDAAKIIKDTKIDESVKSEPKPTKGDEDIENEPDAVEAGKNTAQIDQIDEKESSTVKIDDTIENKTDAVTITEETTKIDESVEIESEPPKIDEITENESDILKTVNDTDKNKTTSDDIVVKIPEPTEPLADKTDSLSKDEIDKSKLLESAAEVIETPMETDAKESSDCTITNSISDDITDTTTPFENAAVEVTTDISSNKSEGVIEIDCIDKEQVIDVDSSDKDPIPKEDTVTDAISSCEDSSDGCTVVETKENTTTNTQEMSVNMPLENKKSNTEMATDIPKSVATSPKPKTICGLSNTLDIISDDEDETPPEAVSETIIEDSKVETGCTTDSKCINLDDDDDIMLIDEDPSKDDKKETLTNEVESEKPAENVESKEISDSPVLDEDNEAASKLEELLSQDKSEEPKTAPVISEKELETPDINEKTVEKSDVKPAPDTKPLVPANFLKTFKSNVAEMTRDELEEFCLIKIVEGIVEKSNLTEIKAKLKTMTQNIEEWRKKAMMLTKQNRDLQIVLKTVQEEQKKRPELPITPLKITRSVGMQVFMTEANERGVKRGRPGAATLAQKTKPLNLPRQPTKPNTSAPIPVPRLVPATASSPAKPRATTQVQSSAISSNTGKASPTTTVKTPPVKVAEKRPLSVGPMSFTVDLTDDEPPAKQTPPRQAPVRLVAQQHLMAPRAQVNNVNSPRKVYIPINSQNQNQLRQGNAIMLKSVAPLGPRQRPPMVRLPNNSATTVRPIRAVSGGRHPAPLPDVAKQQQPPNWKALPPSPDLKISKVENGIVISWKIEGYQEDSYEEIASYQLYAYQETSSPPSTLLWKKIGDVKALPLPMACTLTQFMAGYKYYFAVRAVDIRSRIGPFSLPGSILLLNK